MTIYTFTESAQHNGNDMGIVISQSINIIPISIVDAPHLSVCHVTNGFYSV